MAQTRVMIAMSGGIDSSVAAILLQEQGFELVGVTFQVLHEASASCSDKEKTCCGTDSVAEAKQIAEKLGFEHHVLDLRKNFEKTVIDKFVSEYLAGRTPNPCVDCNSNIKWGELMKKADELNCQFVATGHYAKIRKENKRFILEKGKDKRKDQSYFLWNIAQENLARTLFPLGEYEKAEIRNFAAERGFVKLSQKRESQEICFIQDNDYRNFLRQKVPKIDEMIGKGNFLTTDGKILGQHSGFPFYTIGQRKGLNVAVGHPLYVQRIDAKNNIVVLGKKDETQTNTMIVKHVNNVKYPTPNLNVPLKVKIRYRSEAVDCVIKERQNQAILVAFAKPVSGITPGQSAVFYEGDDLVCGGFIE